MVVDSVKLHYRIWNDELPTPRGNVVFIHGFSGSTFCFRHQYDTLAASGYRIVAVDLPAFGYSDRSTWINHSQSNRARLVWLLLDAIGKSDTLGWNIIGHSMGGGTAEAMALMRSTSTKSLLFIDGMFFNHNNDMMGILNIILKQKTIRDILLDYLENRMISYKRFNKALKNAYGRHADSVEVMGYLTPLRLPGTAEAIFSAITNTKEIQRMNAGELKNMNFVVVWGTKDEWIPFRTTMLIKTAVPSVKLITIKGAGHMPMETHVSEFNRIMIEVLEGD
jgi:pimeloyl-ACP methyl ester carboxylesterase